MMFILDTNGLMLSRIPSPAAAAANDAAENLTVVDHGAGRPRERDIGAFEVAFGNFLPTGESAPDARGSQPPRGSGPRRTPVSIRALAAALLRTLPAVEGAGIPPSARLDRNAGPRTRATSGVCRQQSVQYFADPLRLGLDGRVA